MSGSMMPHPGSTRRGPVSALLVLFAVSFASPGHASGHELSQSELQSAVEEGRAIPFARLLDDIESAMGGELVDARVFDHGGLYYRVLVRQPGGRMFSAVISASTGRFVPVSSEAARQVQESARSAPGQERATKPDTPAVTRGTGNPGSAAGNGGGGKNGNNGNNSGGGGGGNAGGGGPGKAEGSGSAGNAGSGENGPGSSGNDTGGNGTAGSNGNGNGSAGGAGNSAGNGAGQGNTGEGPGKSDSAPGRQ